MLNTTTKDTCINLTAVINDTKTRAFCGPTSIAAITGQPISVVRNACRTARYGNGWRHFDRTPRVAGLRNDHLIEALRLLGYVARLEIVTGRPTLAAWLDNRTTDQVRSTIIVNVTGHYVTVSGYKFVDTFTKGQIVSLRDAPRMRKRVRRIIVITGRCTPEMDKQNRLTASVAKPLTGRRSLTKFCNSVGARWKLDKSADAIEISFADGRKLSTTFRLPDDYEGARCAASSFLEETGPDPKHFDKMAPGAWRAIDIW